MKFGHLIEYDMTNIFPQKSYAKRAGQTSPKNFSRKLKLNIPLNQ